MRPGMQLYIYDIMEVYYAALTILLSKSYYQMSLRSEPDDEDERLANYERYRTLVENEAAGCKCKLVFFICSLNLKILLSLMIRRK